MAPLNEESVQEIATEEQEVELTPEQKNEQLTQLMAEGKRELKAGNFDKCSEKFGEAAEFAAKHYGDFAEESFEPNFQYGRALVELTAVDNDLFKNAPVGMVKKKEEETDEKEEDGDESMTEEEKDDVREMVADALTENAEELEKKATEGIEEETKEEKKDEEAKGDQPAEDSKEEKTEEENESTEDVAAGDNEEGSEKMEDEEEGENVDIEDEDEEDEEEEMDIKELAWEALEVASEIADRMISETSCVTWKRKRADVFVQLAQIAANDEKYELALENLGRALDLMSELENFKEDRLTVEIYFHIDRINRLRNEFNASEEAFNKIDRVMKVKISYLALKKSAAGENPTSEQKDEIDVLESIVGDYKERLEKCKDAQKKMMAVMAEKEKESNPTILTTSNANSDPTATEISSLVRKKRAHDGSEAEKEPKKAKSEGEERNPTILTTSNANSDPTANDISSLVRKKRAHDDSEAEKEPKKAKSEGEEEIPDENVAV